MAKTTKTASLNKKTDTKSETRIPSSLSKQYKIVFGALLVLFSIALLFAFVSFFIFGQQDQSAVREITDRQEMVENWLGKFGAYLADLLIYRGFGLSAFIFVRLFFLTGMYLILAISLKKLRSKYKFTTKQKYNMVENEEELKKALENIETEGIY